MEESADEIIEAIERAIQKYENGDEGASVLADVRREIKSLIVLYKWSQMDRG